MLSNLKIKNFTVFQSADLQFSKHLNVIVGENGSGKTHLLKIAYSALATSWEGSRKPTSSTPTKALMQTRLAEKLINVFRPESLGRLASTLGRKFGYLSWMRLRFPSREGLGVGWLSTERGRVFLLCSTRRKQGRERCEIKLVFVDDRCNFEFSFSTNSKTEVQTEQVPEAWLENAPAYIPTRELLSIFPNFVSVYESHYLEFEETWRDTCILLGAPLQRDSKEQKIQKLLVPLRKAMGGSIELDKNGRFYLRNDRGRFEMPLVAEGQRKLAMLARLIATGALMDNGFLFWDEPEANLNPRLIKAVAQSIVSLSKTGIQVFLATHSLFLLRELEIVMAEQDNAGIDSRFFGLHFVGDGVVIEQGDTIDDVGDIAALDEELAQSDRFIENGASV